MAIAINEVHSKANLTSFGPEVFKQPAARRRVDLQFVCGEFRIRRYRNQSKEEEDAPENSTTVLIDSYKPQLTKSGSCYRATADGVKRVDRLPSFVPALSLAVFFARAPLSERLRL